MRNFSDAVKLLFKNGTRQKCRISVTPASGSAFYITDADIVQNSLVIDRNIMSGDYLPIGSVCASQLDFDLDNREGQYDSIAFAGATMVVSVLIKDWSTSATEETIVLGEYNVTTPPRKSSTIHITALDNMVKFDKQIPATWNRTGISYSTLVSNICSECGVTVNTITPQENPTFNGMPANWKNWTFRTLLHYCGEVMGINFYCDYLGLLVGRRFDVDPSSATYSSISSSDRFESSHDETTVSFATLKSKRTNGTDGYFPSATGYGYTVVNNPLFDRDANMHDLYEDVYQFVSYLPISAACVPLPWFEPGDCIYYVNNQLSPVPTIITHTVFKLNGRTGLESVGITNADAAYAEIDALSPSQNYQITGGLANGSTRVKGECITAGMIRSPSGNCYFDLDNDVLVASEWQKGAYKLNIVDDASAVGGKAIVFSHNFNNLGWYEFFRFSMDDGGYASRARMTFSGYSSQNDKYLDIVGGIYSGKYNFSVTDPDGNDVLARITQSGTATVSRTTPATITFAQPFDFAPHVTASFYQTSGTPTSTDPGQLIVYDVTATGCKIKLAVSSGSTSYTVAWIAHRSH